MAVERGSPVFLEVDTDGDSAWIRADTTTIEKIRFQQSMAVDLEGVSASICMTARGLADPTCGSVSGPYDLNFTRAGRTAAATVLLYGQFIALDNPPPSP